jgi:hypothetical protein
LRERYVCTSIPSGSYAAELGRYLNIDDTTFSSFPPKVSRPENLTELPSVEVLKVIPNPSIECVRVPEPEGGVQEWWARILSGALKDSESTMQVQQ